MGLVVRFQFTSGSKGFLTCCTLVGFLPAMLPQMDVKIKLKLKPSGTAFISARVLVGMFTLKQNEKNR